jgi:hypothetical protein
VMVAVFTDGVKSRDEVCFREREFFMLLGHKVNSIPS